MTIGRLVDRRRGRAADVRGAARAVASGCARRRAGLGPELSMGMTDDFEVAVEEGATIVRVGGRCSGSGRTSTERRRAPGRPATGRFRPATGRLEPWSKRSFGNFIQSILLIALWLLVLGRVLMSWVDPARPQPGVALPRPGHRADPGAGPPDAAAERHVRPGPVHRPAPARDFLMRAVLSL